MGVPRAGDPAAGLGLAARALRGREPAPRGERRRAREPREVARLGGEQERGGDVDALHQAQRVDRRRPLGARGGLDHPALELPLGLAAAVHRVRVVLVC